MQALTSCLLPSWLKKKWWHGGKTGVERWKNGKMILVTIIHCDLGQETGRLSVRTCTYAAVPGIKLSITCTCFSSRICIWMPQEILYPTLPIFLLIVIFFYETSTNLNDQNPARSSSGLSLFLLSKWQVSFQCCTDWMLWRHSRHFLSPSISKGSRNLSVLVMAWIWTVACRLVHWGLGLQLVTFFWEACGDFNRRDIVGGSRSLGDMHLWNIWTPLLCPPPAPER